jgi:biotin carboxylase
VSGVGLFLSRFLVVLLLVFSASAQALSPFAACANWVARAATRHYWLNQGPYVAVVDPYSSGRYLAERLTRRGYRVLAVHSFPEIVDALKGSYRARSVARDFYPSAAIDVAQIEQMADRLSRYTYPHVSREKALKAIFIGSENGVVLGDGLTHLLHLPGNDPALSLTKRDKAKMHERLALLGLAHIRHLRTTSLAKVLKWIHGPENQGRYPVVIKPIDSAATQGVSICETEEEVRNAFKDLMEGAGSRTVFDSRISEVLVQEYLQGVDSTATEEASEYVVNSMSSNGRHIVTDIIRYRKLRVQRANGSHTAIYLFDQFIPLNDPIALEMRKYALEVLDATGVRFGAAHMEVMRTARGPVLVEIGARPAGSGIPEIAARAYTHHPLDIMIDAYLNPDTFNDLWITEQQLPGSSQRFLNHARQVAFIAPNAGTLQGFPYLAALKNLRSYVSHSFNFNVGDFMPLTEDLVSSPGHVELAHPDPAVVEADYQLIRQWERQGFFRIR